MMIWYPKPVLTSAKLGLVVVLGCRLKATSSKAGSKLPLVFQPNDPPKEF